VGKIGIIAAGALLSAVGFVLAFKWLPLVIMGLQFCLVAALVGGGLMVVLFGIIEIKDSIELKKLEEEEKKAGSK
jgi:hypothetical protein